MDTKRITKYADEATVLANAAKNIRHGNKREFILTIGGRSAGSSHAMTNEIRFLSMHVAMPQEVRDQIANGLESAVVVLKDLIKEVVDEAPGDDHLDLIEKALTGIEERRISRLEEAKASGEGSSDVR